MQPVQGRAENQLVHTFSSPGKKGIKVRVVHKEVATRCGEVIKYFVVAPSRYQALLRKKKQKAVAEWAMVVGFASLVGLGVVYFREGLESFGSGADYLASIAWGATAKTGQEFLANLPDWFKKLLGKE